MSSEAQVLLLVLKGAISEMPAEEQEKVKAAAEKIKAVIAEAGDHGKLAMAIVGAEMQVEA